MRITVVRGIGEVPLPEGSYWAAVNDTVMGAIIDIHWQTGEEDVVLRPVEDDPVSEDRGILGDLDRDGRIRVNDLILLYVRAIAPDLYEYDPLANIDGDYGISWNDVALLGQYVYGDPETREALRAEYGIGVALSTFEFSHEFRIDLIWTSDLTERQKEIIREAADRWEEIIWEDLPERDYSQVAFTAGSSSWWINEYSTQSSYRYDQVVDDLIVYVGQLAASEEAEFYAQGGPIRLRDSILLPSVGAVNISGDVLEDDDFLYAIALHELGHVLGFGSVWRHKNLLTGDHRYYKARLACEAYQQAGGKGIWIPVEDGGHWNEAVFGDELMSSRSFQSDRDPISAITVQALADMGYGVDLRQADPYRIPDAGSAKPVAIASRRTQIMMPEYP